MSYFSQVSAYHAMGLWQHSSSVTQINILEETWTTARFVDVLPSTFHHNFICIRVLWVSLTKRCVTRNGDLH